MTPERWQRIHTIFARALHLEKAQRSAYLSEACGSDCRARDEVDSLLAAHEEDPAFLETPAVIAAASDAGADLDRDFTRRRIGAYRLTRRIAAGGMGTVYHAVRDDDAYQKQVAVKLLRADSADDPGRYQELLRRFQLERQTLANLEHPHIARLLDGGAAEDGFPFLVMEYIEGRPIDRYCREQRLSIPQRLELFRLVCSAVQYAHQHLVIHRDLKPGNVLVTPDGEPKLVDFGIAKLLDEAAAPQTAAITRTGAQLLTPLYASPEQLCGQAVTTVSDVYSLGVILYELLTAVHPFEAAISRPHELARVIRDTEPDKPSAVLARFNKPESRRLCGDLDTIVLKALRKEPQRRYPSVEQLSEDLRRYLVGLPVRAAPDTIGYRTKKFVRRHRLGMLSTACILIAVGGGLTGIVRYARIARAERDAALEQEKLANAHLVRAVGAERRADARAANVELVSSALDDLFALPGLFREPEAAQSDPMGAAPGKVKTKAIDILRRTASRIAGELEDEPLVQARLLERIGRVYQQLALHDQGRPLLERSLELRETALGQDHPDVARSLDSLATLLSEKGERDEAERLYRRALAIRRSAHGDSHPDVADSMSNLASVVQDEVEKARLMDEALSLRRALAGEEKLDVANSLNNQAWALHQQGRNAEAEALFAQALAICHRLLEADDFRTAHVMNCLGVVLYAQKKYESAEARLTEALRIRRICYGNAHPDVADTLLNLARVWKATGRNEAAAEAFREVVIVYRKSLGDGHPQTLQACVDLGNRLLANAKYDEAELYFRPVLFHREALSGEELVLASAMRGLGAILLQRANPTEAEPLLRESLAIRRRLTPQSWVTADDASQLGACLTGLHEYDEAGPLLAGGYEALRITRGESDPHTLRALRRLVDFYEAWNKPEQAAAHRAILASVTPDS